MTPNDNNPHYTVPVIGCLFKCLWHHITCTEYL